jgi:hypothetical protein
MSIRSFAGIDDLPLQPGGVRYGTFAPISYQSDYRPEQDLKYAPDYPPGVGPNGSTSMGFFGVSGVLDDLIGGATASTTTAIAAQLPDLIQAGINSSAYQAEAERIRTQAIMGGLLLAGIVVGGVYLVLK